MPDPHDIQEICSRLDRGEIDRSQFLEAFTREMAVLIGCSRAGVWMFIDTAEGRTLHCMAMYDREHDRMVDAVDMAIADTSLYFEALEQEGAVMAPDARSHPATRGFREGYLLPLDIRSVLDVSFSVNGVMFGIFSCEQVAAPMKWTQRQLQWLRQIGSRASLTLLNAATAQADSTMDAMWEPSSPNRLRTSPAPLDPGKRR
jgi:GAF domain-containing protein